jgi:hypothetical protein
MGCFQSKNDLSINKNVPSYGFPKSPKSPINEDPLTPNNTPILNTNEYSKPNLRIRIPNDNIINKKNKYRYSDDETYSLICNF